MPFARLLIERYGDQPVGSVVRRLRCRECGKLSERAWLVAGLHRSVQEGPHPDWAVEVRAVT